jgi:hypothetical protein
MTGTLLPFVLLDPWQQAVVRSKPTKGMLFIKWQVLVSLLELRQL